MFRRTVMTRSYNELLEQKTNSVAVRFDTLRQLQLSSFFSGTQREQ